jgi:hypothetical protein
MSDINYLEKLYTGELYKKVIDEICGESNTENSDKGNWFINLNGEYKNIKEI